MPRDYDEPARGHHRSRRRDAYYTPEREYPRSSRTYYPEPEPEPPRPRGLNEDYYNPPPGEYLPPPAQRSRRERPRGRERERYGEPVGDDSYLPRQSNHSRRAKTQSYGRRHKRYESDFSDDEKPPARPAKLSRRRSFLEKIGLGKDSKKDKDGVVRDRHDDNYRPRYDERHEDRYYGSDREHRRGRSGRRSYTREPSYSPPRRRNTTRVQSVNRLGRVGDGLKRTLTNANWQRAAGQAFRVGASTMYELRNDPSPWMGSKGVRVATAALGAGVLDAFTEDKHRTRSRSGGMKYRAISKVGGAALRHLVGRDKRRGKH